MQQNEYNITYMSTALLSENFLVWQQIFLKLTAVKAENKTPCPQISDARNPSDNAINKM